MSSMATDITRVSVDGYRVLFDRQADGYPASGANAAYDDGVLSLAFIRASDAVRGLPQWVVHSSDLGATWSEPERFGPPLSDPQAQHQSLAFLGTTRRGTLIAAGFYCAHGVREDEHAGDDMRFRPGQALIGRREKGAGPLQWSRNDSGTFLGEQFVAPGLVTRTGRIVLTIWGSRSRGENWQCGVLLSDDDGLTWRYRQVGCEPDTAIRRDPAMPAGYNEQTLFEQHDGSIVSIIRGREKLGAADPAGKETYFLRSISRDGGETWTKPELTNLAGTGASVNGLALADRSLLIAARIPHPHPGDWVERPHPELCGLHLARSFDGGSTWQTQATFQHDPEGRPFDYYYNAMNGQFIALANGRWLYVFGHFDYPRDRHRVLCFTIN